MASALVAQSRQLNGTFTPSPLVRIAKLLRAPEEYDGWKVNQRAPVVGDVGALLDIVHGPGLEDR